MIRMFPILDSALVGLTLFALGACVVRQWGEDAPDWYAYSIVGAAIGYFAVFHVGRKRGANNVDGVFMKPIARAGLLVATFVASVGWVVMGPTDLPTEDLSGADAEVKGLTLAEDADRCQELIAAAQNLLTEYEKDRPAGQSVPPELIGSIGGMARGELLWCEKVDEILERLREVVRAAGPQEPHQSDVDGIIEVFTQPEPREGGPEPYTIEGDPDPSEGNPRVYVVVSPAPESDGGDNGQETPPDTVTKYTYTTEMRDPLLGRFLQVFGIKFGFGSKKITVQEIEAAAAESSETKSGKPLEDLFDSKGLTQIQRQELVDRLIQLGLLEDGAGSDWGDGLRYFASGDLGIALCYAVLRNTGIQSVGGSRFLSASAQVGDLFEEREKLDSDEQDEIDATVYRCLRSNSGKRLAAALNFYKQFGGNLDG